MKQSYQSTAFAAGFAALLALAASLQAAGAAGAPELSRKKLQVFVLAGQSNMTGYCGIQTLTNLANYHELDDPALRELDQRLCKAVFPSEEAVRENNGLRARIYKLHVEKAELNKQLAEARKDKDEAALGKLNKQIKELTARNTDLQAKLQVSMAKRVYIVPDGRYGHKPGVLQFGFGRAKRYIGPEYGFGLTLEQKLDAPILLIKVAQDGAALAYEYRPPSSGPFEPTAAEKERIEALTKRKTAGENVTVPDVSKAGADFRRTVAFTREVLRNLEKYHPEYDPAVGYDLAGFVWFQGWAEDNNRREHGPAYAHNMANLIRDLRRELKAPNMLVVSGTPSYMRTKEKYEASQVVMAQRKVGGMPGFQGNVAIVETLPFYDHPTWPLYTEWKQNVPEWSMIGSHVACHYLGSGRFFVRLGDGLSTAMVELMTRQQ